MTEVNVILDSVNAATGDRITTLRVVMPRIILAELATHRIVFLDDTHDASQILEAYDLDIPTPLTKNSASSRAVPINRMIQRVKDNPFVPTFRKGMKGMGSGESLEPHFDDLAKTIWRDGLAYAIHCAECLANMGVEKGLVNRLLEPFSYIEVLLTATEWNNFLMLRDHPAAQVEIQEVARAIKQEIMYSSPQYLIPGEWHLPYITTQETIDFSMMQWTLQKISAARCARISYKSFDTGNPSTFEEDAALFEKLAGSNPRHLAPLEPPAQAQPDRTRHGNFVGFKSLRKIMFAGEESGGDLR